MPVLEAIDIEKVYRLDSVEIHALKGVSLSIEEGEFVVLMGPSGCGKSTLLSIVGCLDRPSRGRVVIDGVDVSTLGDDDVATLRNHKIGFVFQMFNLLPMLSARANVALPLRYRGVGRMEAEERAEAMLGRLGLADRSDHRPTQLSGGERQRVAIARALVASPSLLLADEPTGNLDSRTTGEIMDVLRSLHAEGVTVLLVTHEADIAQHGQRVVRMSDGRLLTPPGRSEGGVS